MVKFSDYGMSNSDLGAMPNKDEMKKLEYRYALANLTKQEPPERMTLTQLPDTILNLRRE